MAELRCEHVAVAYRERDVLFDVSLVVPRGTLTAILGASGSGKTSLLRTIMGFVRAKRGRIALGDRVVADAGRTSLRPEQRAIGYVAQEGALYPHLTVAQNTGFGLPRRERRHSRRIDEVLELVGLNSAYSSRRPHELSGGEQRRVALARALAPQPSLVLLDEPFSGLDAALRAETRAAVARALDEERTTALLVTHDQAEALSIGAEVGVLQAGRLVQTAAPTALYHRPVDLAVARFVGDAVLVCGHAGGGVVSCPLGLLRLVDPHLQGAVTVMLRPEQIELRPAESGSGLDALPGPRGVGTVTETTFYGPEVMVRIAVGGIAAPIFARSFSLGAPPVGKRVALDVTGPVMAYGDPEPRPAGDLGPGSSTRNG